MRKTREIDTYYFIVPQPFLFSPYLRFCCCLCGCDMQIEDSSVESSVTCGAACQFVLMCEVGNFNLEIHSIWPLALQLGDYWKFQTLCDPTTTPHGISANPEKYVMPALPTSRIP
jgi:hypothetical protein